MPIRAHRHLHNFYAFKDNELTSEVTPSPAGEGLGEENKIKALSISPDPT
ncbi:MAG: hypothetical protein IBX55_04790 [Methyloprofundus sp.]|nr:hypothetical protein [Methyloprofundus sp.]MBW6453678.1 hypothetical protein [Methyloprofundus sp.]